MDGTFRDAAAGRDALSAPRDAVVVLGMPHLSATGLSESWLLKELGHRHWQALAHAAGGGRSDGAPDFRDTDGAPVYAAFCALSIEAGRFEEARENDPLLIRSTLSRLSRTQTASRHRLSVDGRKMGVVTLVSTFVRRTGASGGNHAVARVAVPGLPELAAGVAAGSAADPARTLAERAAAFRRGRGPERLGLGVRTASPVTTLTATPCPGLDFNGAGFLYFATFVALADRTEWQAFPPQALHATTTAREVYFYGNADPGEPLAIHLTAARTAPGGLVHHCRVERAETGAALADIFTTRRVAAPSEAPLPRRREGGG